MNNNESVIITFDIGDIINIIYNYSCQHIFKRSLTNKEMNLYVQDLYRWVKLEFEKEVENNHHPFFRNEEIFADDFSFTDVVQKFRIPEILSHARKEQTGEYLNALEDNIEYIANISYYRGFINRAMNGPTWDNWVIYAGANARNKLFLKNMGNFKITYFDRMFLNDGRYQIQ